MMERQRATGGRVQVGQIMLGGVLLALALGPIRAAQADVVPDLQQQLAVPLYNGTLSYERHQADRLVYEGRLLAQDGALSDAIAHWQQALAFYQKVDDLEAQGPVYAYLAEAYLRLGQYPEAEHAVRRRLGVANTRGDYISQVYALNALGRAIAPRGGVRAADETFDRALTVSRSIDSLDGTAVSYDSKGLLAAGEGRLDQATAYYEASLSASRRAVDPVREATTLNHMGDLYLAQGGYTNALKYHGLAVRIARISGDRQNQFHAIDGVVASLNGLATQNPAFYNQSLELLNERLVIARQLENPQQELVALDALGRVYQQLRDYPNAERSYEQALLIAQEINPQQASELRIRLASFRRDR